MNYRSFIFEKFNFNKSQKKLTCSYSFDSQVFFEEEFIFDFEFIDHYGEEALENAIFGLFVMCGVSYFKAALPPKIMFRTGGLNQEQKKFFDKIYRIGLGEFFYTNGIDPRGKVNFEQLRIKENQKSNTKSKIENQKSKISGSLVPIGGGKDSLVTAEILESAGEDFETWTVGDKELLNKLCVHVGKPHIKIYRKISPKLLELNKKGALNGHVPISAILSFLSVVTAILRGKKNIIFSNESSANEANLEFHDQKINHQYSKTLEFEKDFQDYTRKFISPEIQYFSLLRPLTELKIAQIFCTRLFDKYEGYFAPTSDFVPVWCGECPKCAFVFAIFSPFLEREKLLNLFGGKNLFADPELDETFRELLGLSGSKPFECVGEISEVRKGLSLAKNTENWPELEKFKFSNPNYDFERFSSHVIPEKFEKILKNLL